jgi:DNA-binding IclR family transcriptional regulator
MAASSPYRDLSTLQRGLAVVAFLCREGEAGFNAIAGHLGLAPTIVSRLLKDLIAGDWVERHPDSGHYLPGPRVADLQIGAPTAERARILAEPILRELCVETGNTAVVIWRENNMPIAKVTHEDAIAMRRVGTAFVGWVRYPWGWWFLADCSTEERDALVAEETDSAWRKRALLAIADAKRADFFALRLPGNTRLAAPVRTRNGALVAALGLGGTPTSLPDRRCARYGAKLAEAAGRLGRMLGGASSSRSE